MTHQDQTTALDQITELLAEHGFDGMAQAVVVLLNEVMKLERTQALGAGPYQ
jgi:putative transposase